MAKVVVHYNNHDGMDRGFLECMAWVGTSVVWTAGGGIFGFTAFGDSTLAGA